MTMQTVNEEKKELQGCMEYLELKAEGVKTYAYMFMM